MSTAPSRQRRASGQACQLYVELEWMRPKVLRRILVPITIELPLLYVTLLFGIGWEEGHSHEFVFADANYGANEPGLDLPPEVMDEEHVMLREVLGSTKTFAYVYDYGDNWRHKVRVEKVVTLDAPMTRGQSPCLPTCTCCRSCPTTHWATLQ